MFPNPQDALPLPPRPDILQYKKLAKELVRICKTGERDSDSEAAFGEWSRRWVDSLGHDG